MVEREPDPVRRIEHADDPRIALELPTVTLDLAVEEARRVGAFVRAGLEVDDPALAVRDERAVDDDVHDFAPIDPHEVLAK